MSHDLYFFKQKGSNITTEKISNYLSGNLAPASEGNKEWFYENEDTGVYFLFTHNVSLNDTSEDEESNEIKNFDNTNFSFNLNYLRPSFFGLEAFGFLEQFCDELNLFILNPQSHNNQPYKPDQEEEFENWNKTNLQASRDHFKQLGCCYLSEDETTRVWKYNSNRKIIQKRLGDGYFVPKILFFRKKQNNEPFTLTVWTEHIPIVLPLTDYVLLTRQYRTFFSKKKDTVLIPRADFLDAFEDKFDSFDFPDCKIIHQSSADQLIQKFNSIKGEAELKRFADRLSMENLYNARPY